MADAPDTAEDGPAIVKQMAAETTADLQARMDEFGRDAALGVAFALLSGAVTFIARTMGAQYAVETLDGYGAPLRDLMELHGAPGRGLCQ